MSLPSSHAPEHSPGTTVEVNGLQMYYEVHTPSGPAAPEGAIHAGFAPPPLVLLHGALSAIGTSFGRLLPGLAQNRPVIAIDQQAHGRTTDADRPLTLEQMAKDTAALLRLLQVHRADFFGYSMGGGIAMQLALTQPALVRRLVFMGGANFSPSGYYPEVLEGIDQITPALLEGSPWQQEYAQVAPDPAQWPVLVEKVKQFDRSYKGWKPKDIRAVQAPTLIIVGDADIVRPEHAVELFRLLGGGAEGYTAGPRSQLAILPGTDHVALPERADLLLPMVEDFLSEPDPSPE